MFSAASSSHELLSSISPVYAKDITLECRREVSVNDRAGGAVILQAAEFLNAGK
jgi:hypothetical protein